MEEELQGGDVSREPKIDLVVAILIGICMAVLDLLELIPFVGEFTSVLAIPVFFYLYLKGVNGVVFLVGNGLDFIPVIQEFPCKTLAWCITVGIDRFAPKSVTEKLEQVGEMAQAKAGGSVATGGGAAAGETAAQAARETSRAERMAKEAGSRMRDDGSQAQPAQPGQPVEGQDETYGSEEMGGEDGQQDGEPREKTAREKDLERLMQSGAERSPEEEAMEAVFDPEEARFREARKLREEGREAA